MKNRTLLITSTLFVLLFSGCSKHSSAATSPKVSDFGVIEVSDGIPSRHILADGRACVVTPTILKDGRVKLVTSVRGTNASGEILTSSLAIDVAADQPTTFAFDKSNVISLTLHISK